MSTGAALRTAPISENTTFSVLRFFREILEILSETRSLREQHRSRHPSLEW
jgi:hypothetical protein